MPPSTSASIFHEITLSRLHLGHIALILLASLPLAVLAGYLSGRVVRKRLREEGDAIDKIASETTMNAFLTLARQILLQRSYIKLLFTPA
jgi:hypothetical protein